MNTFCVATWGQHNKSNTDIVSPFKIHNPQRHQAAANSHTQQPISTLSRSVSEISDSVVAEGFYQVHRLVNILLFGAR